MGAPPPSFNSQLPPMPAGIGGQVPGMPAMPQMPNMMNFTGMSGAPD
jgi:hypothetical protein